MGASDGRARFGLPNDIHRTRCEELRPEVEQALSSHFDCPVLLDLVVDPGAEGAPQAPVGKSPEPGRRPAPSEAAGEPPTTAPPGAGPGGTASASPASAAEATGDDAHVVEDLSAFDESELGEVAVVDNSAHHRVLQAFPGAEEVT